MFFFTDCTYMCLEIFVLFISFYYLFYLIILAKYFNFVCLYANCVLYFYTIILGILILFNNFNNYFFIFNYQLIGDDIIFLEKFIVLVLFLLFILYFYKYFSIEKKIFLEIFFFIKLLIFSSLIFLMSNDFIIFFIFLEFQSLIIYVLMFLKKYDQFSNESGLKYFVLSVFSTGLFLFGVSIFYGMFGVLNFLDLKFLFLKWLVLDMYFYYFISIVILFLISIFLFKLGSVPFQCWLPDIYEGTSTLMVFYFSILSKLIFFFYFFKLFFYFYEFFNSLFYILFIFGLISVFLGSISSLNQINIKRLYAYSSIVNIGYLLILFSFGSIISFEFLFNHMFIYIISTFILFFLLIFFRKNQCFEFKNLMDLKNLFYSNKILVILLSFSIFSFMGIPPFAGFFTKFFIFYFLFNFNDITFYFLFLFFINILIIIYYLKFIYYLFFNVEWKFSLFLPVKFFNSLIISFFSYFLFIGFIFFQEIVLLKFKRIFINFLL